MAVQRLKWYLNFWDTHSYHFHVGSPDNKICLQHQSKTSTVTQGRQTILQNQWWTSHKKLQLDCCSYQNLPLWGVKEVFFFLKKKFQVTIKCLYAFHYLFFHALPCLKDICYLVNISQRLSSACSQFECDVLTEPGKLMHVLSIYFKILKRKIAILQ